MMAGNLILAQSGGPTAVINGSIAGVVMEALRHKEIGGIYGAVNGIEGVLDQNLVDLRAEEPEVISGLRSTPSAALGSCRRKLKADDYQKILDVLKKYEVRYFLIAGGNDSMDTALQMHKLARSSGYELFSVGVPKTVDNDLRVTDHCPGYGSVARYWAISGRDAGRDTDAIYHPDTVKILETMGRDTGWITAAAGLACEAGDDAPQLVYVPEIPFDQEQFLGDVDRVYRKLGRVVIAVCEGLKDKSGEFVTASGRKTDTDSFGHKQLGGVGDVLCDLIAEKLGLKSRFDKPGTIQRMAMVCASEVDREEAYQVGKQAVRLALAGRSGVMVTIERQPGAEYRVAYGTGDLTEIANLRKDLPREFMNAAGNHVSQAFLDYARPLAGGPLPPYVRLKKVAVPKR